MDILQGLGLITGWPGLIFLILSVVFGSLYVRRASKNQASEIAKKADKEAIESLQRQVGILQDRVKDTENENRRLEQTLETILDVLKSREIYITIQGHTINIREGRETTITRIDETKEQGGQSKP